MSLIKKFAFLFLPFVILHLLPGCKDPVSANGSNDVTEDTTTGQPSGDTVVVDVGGWGPDQIDSLFALLVERVQHVENVESYSEYEMIDFSSLRDGFQSYLAGIDAELTKANVGYVVSATLSLNTSSKIAVLADSIDAYIRDIDEYYFSYEENPIQPYSAGPLKKTVGKSTVRASNKTLRRIYDRHGVQGLGQFMLANASELLAAQTAYPTIPRIITINYIQSAIESELLPTLNRITAACERLEKKSTVLLSVDFDGNAYEIDKADIYALDAGMHLFRAALYLLTTYEMNLYTSESDNSNSWIDSLLKIEDTQVSSSYSEYTLSGDTLFQTYHYQYSDDQMMRFLGTIYHYNWERDDFLTIRKQHHRNCHEDLLAVPELIKKGIASINGESDEQDSDLIPIGAIADADADLFDLSQEMLEMGFTNQMARKFRSLESLMDFVTEALSGPVAINETVDGVTVNMTVNISAFFENPIQDLRELYPKFQWRPEEDMVMTWKDTSYYSNNWEYSGNSFSYCDDYDSTIINIPPSEIDSVVSQSWDNSCRRVYLKSGYSTEAGIHSYRSIQLIDLVDDQGLVIDLEREFEDETFFPYFADYTFNGIFPGMTRQRWIQMVWQ